jgi:hypothetical protein
MGPLSRADADAAIARLPPTRSARGPAALRLANPAQLRSNSRMRKPDEDAFRDSVKPREAVRRGFHEPSVSTRGSRTLQRGRKSRSIWPRVAVALVLVGAVVMLWVRFGAR